MKYALKRAQSELKKRSMQKSSIIGGHAIHYCAYDQFDLGKIDFRYQTLFMSCMLQQKMHLLYTYRSTYKYAGIEMISFSRRKNFQFHRLLSEKTPIVDFTFY